MELYVWELNDPAVVSVFASNESEAEQLFRKLVNKLPDTKPRVFTSPIGFFVWGPIDDEVTPDQAIQ